MTIRERVKKGPDVSDNLENNVGPFMTPSLKRHSLNIMNGVSYGDEGSLRDGCVTMLPVLLMLQNWLPGISLISISWGMDEKEISRPHTEDGWSEY